MKFGVLIRRRPSLVTRTNGSPCLVTWTTSPGFNVSASLPNCFWNCSAGIFFMPGKLSDIFAGIARLAPTADWKSALQLSFAGHTAQRAGRTALPNPKWERGRPRQLDVSLNGLGDEKRKWQRARR